VTPAWFRQDLADLPLRKSLYDAIQDHDRSGAEAKVQNCLGRLASAEMKCSARSAL
jgi:ATP-binding cassette subfamily F protein 3